MTVEIKLVPDVWQEVNSTEGDVLLSGGTFRIMFKGNTGVLTGDKSHAVAGYTVPKGVGAYISAEKVPVTIVGSVVLPKTAPYVPPIVVPVP